MSTIFSRHHNFLFQFCAVISFKLQHASNADERQEVFRDPIKKYSMKFPFISSQLDTFEVVAGIPGDLLENTDLLCLKTRKDGALMSKGIIERKDGKFHYFFHLRYDKPEREWVLHFNLSSRAKANGLPWQNIDAAITKPLDKVVAKLYKLNTDVDTHCRLILRCDANKFSSPIQLPMRLYRKEDKPTLFDYMTGMTLVKLKDDELAYMLSISAVGIKNTNIYLDASYHIKASLNKNFFKTVYRKGEKICAYAKT